MTILYQFLTRDEDIYITTAAGEILKHYGADNQLDKLAEECAEFAAARLKNRISPSQEAADHEMDELADVIVMLEQIVQSQKPAQGRRLAGHVMVKLDRQLRRISQEGERDVRA